MWTAEGALGQLRARGELWEPSPGLVALSGEAALLLAGVERALEILARSEDAEEWRVAPGIPVETLHRAGYFASFPQWLTVASHLGGEQPLERLAGAADGAAARAAIAAAVTGPGAALPPAVCYHVYAALAGQRLTGARVISAQGCCWRHEGERHAALERGWAFTMRESVCVGTDEDTTAFRERGMARTLAFAREVGLACEVELASDPFFAPTARGRALLQRLKALKHELLLPLGNGRRLAAASFNHHERFFGDAFDIRGSDGVPASSACVAFGVERWLLAIMVAHGPRGDDWPDLEQAARRACNATSDLSLQESA